MKATHTVLPATVALAALSACVAGTIAGQAGVAHRRIGAAMRALTFVPGTDGCYGDGDGDPVRMVMLGDSVAAGFGVSDPDTTVGPLLARALSQHVHRPVMLTNVARVGARSVDVHAQGQQALHGRPDVAVIIVGANDVTHLQANGAAAHALRDTVTNLRQVGAHVVVGTCPDLGAVRPVPTGLRHVLSVMSNRYSHAQCVTVTAAGGVAVCLADAMSRDRTTVPGSLFADDGFHPSQAGHRRLAAALAAAVCAADVPAAPLSGSSPGGYVPGGVDNADTFCHGQQPDLAV